MSFLSSSTSALAYKAQRTYVATMFEVLGRLLVAGSAADPVIQRELPAFPEGYAIGFSVLGDSLALRLVKRGDHLEADPSPATKPDLEIVFKHIAHAFALLSFQESTPTAFANDRLVSHGDVGLSMRFVRCLDRVQGIMLPDPIASLALKSLPNIPLGERLRLAARITGGLVQSLYSSLARTDARLAPTARSTP
ncbi:MAG: hypothetical protein JWN48_908 [Myxococcaceae bacterium]|nr:hypothetical protein [Myxococcaceae bacterium]